MFESSKEKDAIPYAPTVQFHVPAIVTTDCDQDGNLQPVRRDDEEGSYSANFKGDLCEESVTIENRVKRNKKTNEKHVVKHLLHAFNEANSSKFALSEGVCEEDNIEDVYIEDTISHGKLGIQVTVSDADAIHKLRTEKTFSRRGDSYELFSVAIKSRIEEKGDKKYELAERKKRF